MIDSHAGAQPGVDTDDDAAWFGPGASHPAWAEAFADSPPPPPHGGAPPPPDDDAPPPEEPEWLRNTGDSDRAAFSARVEARMQQDFATLTGPGWPKAEDFWDAFAAVESAFQDCRRRFLAYSPDTDHAALATAGYAVVRLVGATLRAEASADPSPPSPAARPPPFPAPPPSAAAADPDALSDRPRA